MRPSALAQSNTVTRRSKSSRAMSSHCVHKASAAGSVPAAVRTKQEAVELGHNLTPRPAPVCLLPPGADRAPHWLSAAELARGIVTSQALSVQPCVRPHMMVSPSSANLGRSRSKVGLSFSAGLPLQTSHPAGVDPSHCPAFGTGRAPRERHHSV
jgi:hypothetical protein